jgi:predicted ATPase
LQKVLTPMPIEKIIVEGYRSVRNLFLKLGQVNLIVGANGCGKTNLYRAVYLLQAAAEGNLARSLAEEGGMPSVTWAGDRYKNDPVRVNIGVVTDQFEFQLSLGLPVPGRSAFDRDPVIKEEHLWYIHKKKRAPWLDRGNTYAKVRDSEGEFGSYPSAVELTESALSEFRDPVRFPILASVRQEFSGWRFYHQFRTDFESPLRRPQGGCRTPILSSDGADLAAALQTITESGDGEALTKSIHDAFPGAALSCVGAGGFVVSLDFPEFKRPFSAKELSDGTLKYLCLLAALLTPRPPGLMCLNEPEASLHPDLMPPLARLIALASKNTQLWITTHSELLAQEVKRLTGAEPIRLEKHNGETKVVINSED